jgi:hypothetical protein
MQAHARHIHLRLETRRPFAADATLARAALKRDWIDNHDFSEPSVEAMDVVDWVQIPPHERILALHHAERRASMALLGYRGQLKGGPRPHVTYADSLSLDRFADGDGGDTDKKNVLSPLPKFTEPGLGSDPRVTRTIVVLAKLYHRPLALRDEAALEAGH